MTPTQPAAVAHFDVADMTTHDCEQVTEWVKSFDVDPNTTRTVGSVERHGDTWWLVLHKMVQAPGGGATLHPTISAVISTPMLIDLGTNPTLPPALLDDHHGVTWIASAP